MTDLDEKEQGHVRTALRYLRRQLGTWAAVAKAIHCASETVRQVASGHDTVGVQMAFRIARLVDVPVDDLVAGRYLPGACPRCGHLPDFADEPTTVESAPRPPTAPAPRGNGLKLVR